MSKKHGDTINESEARHNQYLNNLIKNLYETDINPREVKLIIKDGIWQPYKGSTQRVKMCDLIVVHHDDYAIPIELKGSPEKRHKAKLQIDSGRKLIEQVLHLPCYYGEFVSYEGGKYHVERVVYR